MVFLAYLVLIQRLVLLLLFHGVLHLLDILLLHALYLLLAHELLLDGHVGSLLLRQVLLDLFHAAGLRSRTPQSLR